MSWLVYGIPNCNTVKKARTWFDEQGQACGRDLILRAYGNRASARLPHRPLAGVIKQRRAAKSAQRLCPAHAPPIAAGSNDDGRGDVKAHYPPD